MQKSVLERLVLILALLVLSSTILYFARPLLVPVAIGALLTMLFVPVSSWLEKKGVNRGVAAFLCLLCFLLVVGGVAGLLGWQVSNIAEDITDLKKSISGLVNKLQDYVSDKTGISQEKQDEIVDGKTHASGGGMGSIVTSVVGSVFVFAGNAVLTLVYMLLMLYFRTHFRNFILKLIPADQQAKTKKIIAQSSHIVQQYLSGLAIMIVMLWVMYGIGFSIVGVKSALFFAILCGVLEIIPYVGNITGCSLAALMALSQGGGMGMVAGVLVTYGIVQFIQSNIVAPLILGSEVNINPLFIIIVLIVGELVWGLPGMIIAIPLLAIVKIVFDNVPTLQPYGFLIGNEKKRKENFAVVWLKRVRNKLQ